MDKSSGEHTDHAAWLSTDHDSVCVQGSNSLVLRNVFSQSRKTGALALSKCVVRERMVVAALALRSSLEAAHLAVSLIQRVAASS